MTSSGEASLLGKREPKDDDLETEPILKKHKENSEEEKETTRVFADRLQQINGRVELLETNSDQANLIPAKETVVERLNETPDFVKAVAVRNKTLFVDHLPVYSDISNIIKFFKDVGQVVSVQLTLNGKGKRTSNGFVEFASANEAKKAQENKNGKCLGGKSITLHVVAEIAPYPPRPKYCLYHKVWNEDYLRQESLPIEEANSTFVETVAKIRKTLFVANLSPQTKILHIVNFFKDVAKVVSVRLIVNDEGKHVGYGFVEFASHRITKKKLEEKNGEYLHDHRIFLDVATTAPYSPGPKYNLVEKLWYEDYLLRESRLIVEDETLEGLDETHNFVQAVAVREKTLRVSHISNQTKISDIINFFKDVATVVHVRLGVNYKGKQFGDGFVEFASANEAKKALEKDGEYLHNRKIYVAKADPSYSLRPKYCIDHKVWYEDYLRQESLLIEEDEAVEGLDEICQLDLVEEVSVRKKTLFIANLSLKTKLLDIINFFYDVGEVVSVRLIGNHRGKHVGCGFIEFASANQAKKALQKKNCGRLLCYCIVLDVAEIAPYPLRPKYNLAEKLWYEDYLRRESILIREDDLETKLNLKKQKKHMGVFCGRKITFSHDD